MGNLSHMETRNGEGRVLISQRIERDSVGFVIGLDQRGVGLDGVEASVAVRFRYDRANRLASEERVGADGTVLSRRTYEYDANGNRLRVTDQNGDYTTYAYDGANQLLRETSEQGTIVYAYDANGNLVSETFGGERVSYRYDHENRLVATRGPSFSVDYLLAPDGRRLAKTVNGMTTTYAYAGLHAIHEATDHGQVDYAYGPGIDELLMRDRGGARDYYHRAVVNSVLGLTDQRGKVVASYDYTAFGQLVNAEEHTFNPYRYTGRRLDPETGMYHFRERALSTRTGRFGSLDPIRTDVARSIRFGKLPTLSPDAESPLFAARLEVHVSGMDLAGYAYAGTNPVNAMDPTGEIVLWNPISVSVTSGCAGSVCPASGCLGSGCVGSGCIGSACGGSGCAGSACGGSACGGSGCAGSACAASACVSSGCLGSICVGSGCLASICVGSACLGSACGGSGCVNSLCGSSSCSGSACYMGC